MTPTPLLMAAPDRDAAPHAYVVHKHSQLCRCGSLHEWTKLYAKTHFKARMGHKYVTNLRPVREPTEITYNLPIEIVAMPIERLLFCHECIANDTLAHLPKAPIATDEEIAAKLRDMGVIKHEVKRTRYWKDGSERSEEAAQAQARKAPKRTFTVDDL